MQRCVTRAWFFPGAARGVYVQLPREDQTEKMQRLSGILVKAM